MLLIATDTHYYLLNVVTKVVFTGEVGVAVTENEPYAIVVLDRQQLCECAVETDNIYLMGTASSSVPGLILQYTYNFVAEWLKNRETIPFYHENIHILNVPTNTLFPYIPYFSDNDDYSDIYNEQNVEVINLDKLDNLYNSIKNDEHIFLFLADKTKHESTIYQNKTAENQNSILDIDS